MLEKKVDSFFDLGKTTLQQLYQLKEIAMQADKLEVNDLPLFSFAEPYQKYSVLERIETQIQIEELKFASRSKKRKENIQKAKNAGVKIGRVPKDIPTNFDIVAEQYQQGKISQRKAGEILGVSNHTFAKWLKIKENS